MGEAGALALVFVAFVAFLWWVVYTITKKAQKYEDIEINAVEQWLLNHKPQHYLLMNDNKAVTKFQKELEKRVTEEFFEEYDKKRNKK